MQFGPSPLLIFRTRPITGCSGKSSDRDTAGVLHPLPWRRDAGLRPLGRPNGSATGHGDLPHPASLDVPALPGNESVQDRRTTRVHLGRSPAELTAQFIDMAVGFPMPTLNLN